jgi:predicted PurR-regulated permease PerM
MKKIIGVPALLVILSLIAGVELAGFVGVILSIPLSVLIVEFLDDKKRRDAVLEEESV